MLFSSFRDGNQEVYSMNADGTGVIRLTNSPGHDDYAVWSPDGKRIAFTSNRDGQATGADLYLMNIDGTQIKRLTTTGSSTYPSWEPHGRLITYTSRDSFAPGIYVIDPLTLAYTRLTFGAVGIDRHAARPFVVSLFPLEVHGPNVGLALGQDEEQAPTVGRELWTR